MTATQLPATGGTTVLSAQDHAHFLEHGFVVVKNVASPEAIRAGVAQLENGAYTGTVGAADYKPVKAEALPACYGPRFFGAISELFNEPYALGPRFAGSDMPRPHEPAKAGEWKLAGGHIDDDYPTIMPAGWSLGSFLFLTPVRSRGGAFVYFPGSYRRIRAAMTHTPLAAKWHSDDRAENLGPPREFLAEPGDLLLFHHLCGHAGSTNVADPVTRHALLSRHHTKDRLVPGAKPFEGMSTIEKANSSRYLRERMGDTVAVMVIGDRAGIEASLQRGLTVSERGVPAACPFHFAGRAWLFIAAPDTPGGPGQINVLSSANMADWQREESIAVPVQGVDSISLFLRHKDVYLFAGSRRLGATAVLTSQDLKRWGEPVVLPGTGSACGHYSTDYGSKVGRGHYTLTADADGSTVQARVAPTMPEAFFATTAATTCAAPDGRRIVGFTAEPTLGEGAFAVLADVARDADSASEVMVSRGNDAIRFEQPLALLPHDCPAPPRHIRAYMRARDYWLVTYLRRAGDHDRVFWGVIDWSASQPTLRELTGAAGLQTAIETIGLI